MRWASSDPFCNKRAAVPSLPFFLEGGAFDALNSAIEPSISILAKPSIVCNGSTGKAFFITLPFSCKDACTGRSGCIAKGSACIAKGSACIAKGSACTGRSGCIAKGSACIAKGSACTGRSAFTHAFTAKSASTAKGAFTTESGCIAKGSACTGRSGCIAKGSACIAKGSVCAGQASFSHEGTSGCIAKGSVCSFVFAPVSLESASSSEGAYTGWACTTKRHEHRFGWFAMKRYLVTSPYLVSPHAVQVALPQNMQILYSPFIVKMPLSRQSSHGRSILTPTSMLVEIPPLLSIHIYENYHMKVQRHQL
jgi:hypothetical protein